MESEGDAQTCLEDGSWSTHSIACKRQSCPLPFTSQANVVFSGTVFTVNESIVISCEEGYRLSGANISTCQVNVPAGLFYKQEFCSNAIYFFFIFVL